MKKALFIIAGVLTLSLIGCEEETVSNDPVQIAKDIKTQDITGTSNVYKGTIGDKEYYISRKPTNQNHTIRTFKCAVGDNETGISRYYSEEDKYPRVVDYKTYKKTWDYYVLGWADTSTEIRADTGWEYSDEESNYILYVSVDNKNKFSSPQEPILNDYLQDDYKVDIYIQDEKTESKDNWGDGYILVIPTELGVGNGRFTIHDTITENTWNDLVRNAGTNADERRTREIEEKQKEKKKTNSIFNKTM